METKPSGPKGMKAVVCGIGNTMRGDDCIGSYVIDKLQDEKLDNVCLIECGLAPENFAGKIVSLRPGTVIFVDAADFDGSPGDVRIIRRSEISKTSLSTHKLSLDILISFIEKDTGADIIFIGIKPKNIGLEDDLSDECRKAAKKAKKMIIDILDTRPDRHAV